VRFRPLQKARQSRQNFGAFVFVIRTIQLTDTKDFPRCQSVPQNLGQKQQTAMQNSILSQLRFFGKMPVRHGRRNKGSVQHEKTHVGLGFKVANKLVQIERVGKLLERLGHLARLTQLLPAFSVTFSAGKTLVFQNDIATAVAGTQLLHGRSAVQRALRFAAVVRRGIPPHHRTKDGAANVHLAAATRGIALLARQVLQELIDTVVFAPFNANAVKNLAVGRGWARKSARFFNVVVHIM